MGEELLLGVFIGNEEQQDSSFTVSGLSMEGACWKGEKSEGQLAMTEELTVGLPATQLKWLHRDSAEYKAVAGHLQVPVYLNTSRLNLISSFKLRSPGNIPTSTWTQRSACVTLWTKQ